MASDSSLIIQFIAETRDNLEDAARGLLELENAADQDLINSIFRNFHTIKGTSGIFPEFKVITTLTHVAEDLMDQIRNGRMQLVAEHIDLFLNTLDLVSTWLDAIEEVGAVPLDAPEASTPLNGQISEQGFDPTRVREEIIRFEKIFDSYVMDDQRKVHGKAVGTGSAASSLASIELF